MCIPYFRYYFFFFWKFEQWKGRSQKLHPSFKISSYIWQANELLTWSFLKEWLSPLFHPSFVVNCDQHIANKLAFMPIFEYGCYFYYVVKLSKQSFWEHCQWKYHSTSYAAWKDASENPHPHPHTKYLNHFNRYLLVVDWDHWFDDITLILSWHWEALCSLSIEHSKFGMCISSLFLGTTLPNCPIHAPCGPHQIGHLRLLGGKMSDVESVKIGYVIVDRSHASHIFPSPYYNLFPTLVPICNGQS
jgi:hypothetical protein